MVDVRVTVDGLEVFARDCTDFECEESASGQFEARGSFGAIRLDPVPTGTFVPDLTCYGLITDIETPDMTIYGSK